MKTLLLNGSPRKKGDTAFLLSVLRQHLEGEIIEIAAYYSKISPCIDCRACQKKKGCVIRDDMQFIYDGEFDNVVIASPLYMSNLTSPLMGIASRFQAFYCAKRFLKDPVEQKAKKGALVLVGGGDGGPDAAIALSEWMLKKMNAEGYQKHRVFSLKTDIVPAREDTAAISKMREMATFFNIQ